MTFLKLNRILGATKYTENTGSRVELHCTAGELRHLCDGLADNETVSVPLFFKKGNMISAKKPRPLWFEIYRSKERKDGKDPD